MGSGKQYFGKGHTARKYQNGIQTQGNLDLEYMFLTTKL